jgi:hypothetical protein
MNKKLSAYLSIYNDWDILRGALSSVADKVDEIVILDGAYDWMVPYYTAIGCNPERSDDRVYDAISDSRIPHRIIRKTWKDEIDKRIFGFSACAGRYICRLDSDEIYFFDDEMLNRFFSEGQAVGQLEMPELVAPGWMLSGEPIGRQCFLFDRDQIDAESHLDYLWLVLTAEQRPKLKRPRVEPFDPPVAFNAHLTHWRTWQTSIYRAAFYVLNYMRGFGVPFIPHLAGKPLLDFQCLFDVITPEALHEFFLTNPIVTGDLHFSPGSALRRVPLSDDKQATYRQYFTNYTNGVLDLIKTFTEVHTHFIVGQIMTFDLSALEVQSIIVRNGNVIFETKAKIVSALARVDCLHSDKPWISSEKLETSFENNKLTMKIGSSLLVRNSQLRRTLKTQIWVEGGRLLDSFKIVS